MKTIKFTGKLFMILLTTVFFIACSPEDGTDGLNGINGVDGVDGADGAQGEDGNANVISSDWFNTEFSNNIVATSSSFAVDATEINAAILNFGTILVYARRIDGEALVYQLPIVFGAARQQSYYYRASQDEIRITVVANEEGESVGDGAFLEQYRYILIPGSNSATSKSSIDYTKMTYEEIIEHFNIPE